eukprot:CAMPEP_0180418928 /NCGR_PEP_ID=MMETSP1036_2-20121128/1822_1 /TAXON_ID=632150 /ORGANISM="Azadinium spinosum, Strain 3D9" /LENGTH=35 /DNA_ID= /DNA_START= /DNA_END= /DNA_ORIENTATION=
MATTSLADIFRLPSKASANSRRRSSSAMPPRLTLP